MTEIFAGQCQCGDVKYQVTGTAASLFASHCTECQRQSASAFGLALWIEGADVQLLRGELKEWFALLRWVNVWHAASAPFANHAGSIKCWASPRS